MPKIPVYRAEVPIKSPTPETGLRPAPVGIETPQWEALGEVGKTIGQLGEVIYQHELKRREKGKKVIQEKIETEAYQKLMLEYKTRIDSQIAEGNLEGAIKTWKVFQIAKEKIPDYSDPANVSEDEFGSFADFARYWTDEEREMIKLRRSEYFNKYEATIAPKIVEAEDTIRVKTIQEANIQDRDDLRNGIGTYEEKRARIINRITSIYGDTVKAKSLIQNEIKALAIDYQQDAIDKRNPIELELISRGYYEKDLFGDTAVINRLRDEAQGAVNQNDIEEAVERHRPALVASGYNRQVISEIVRKDKSLDFKKQNTVINILESEAVTYHSSKDRERVEGQREEKNYFFKLINEGKNNKALLYLNTVKYLDEGDKRTMEKIAIGPEKTLKTDEVYYNTKKREIYTAIEDNDAKKLNELRKEIISQIGKKIDGKSRDADFLLALVEKKDPERDNVKRAHKILEEARKDGIFDNKSQLNDIAWAKHANALDDWIAKNPDKDPLEFLKPILEAEKKGWVSRKLDWLIGIGRHPLRSEAIEILKRNNLPATEENIQIVVKRLREKGKK